jgi:hypothetical protein
MNSYYNIPTTVPTVRLAKVFIGYWIVSNALGALCGPVLLLTALMASTVGDKDASLAAISLISLGLLCLVTSGVCTWLGILAYKSLNVLRAYANRSLTGREAEILK